MYKQLSRNKHHHQQSVDDFMKQIRKYNLKSERYLSPKPLLYMYSNPRNHTLHTIERDKSKTLSNRQSQSKKTAKNVRQKVQCILSIGKNTRMKSSQSFSKSQGRSKLNSQQNQRKFSTINDDQSQDSPMKNRYKIKSKISKKSTQATNPGDLIDQYSKKIRKAEKYLQTKSKLGKMLCGKFLQMLNQIVDSMVKNLHSSLAQLEQSISQRVTKQMDHKYKRVLQHSQKVHQKLERKFEKLAKTHMEILDKQNYNNQLIYDFRKQNIDVDNIFGRTFLGTDKLGGRGYHKSILDNNQDFLQDQISQKQSKKPKHKQKEKEKDKDDSSSQQIYQFIAHPAVNAKNNKKLQPSQKPQHQKSKQLYKKEDSIKQKPHYISKSNEKQNPLINNFLYLQEDQKQNQQKGHFTMLQREDQGEHIVKIGSSSEEQMMFEDRIKPFVKNNRRKKQQQQQQQKQKQKQKDPAFVDEINESKNFFPKNDKIQTLKKNSKKKQKNESF